MILVANLKIHHQSQELADMPKFPIFVPTCCIVFNFGVLVSRVMCGHRKPWKFLLLLIGRKLTSVTFHLELEDWKRPSGSNTTMATKLYHKVPHPLIFGTFSGMVTPPLLWVAYSNLDHPLGE